MDFEEVYVNQGKRDGGRGKESDGEGDEESDGEGDADEEKVAKKGSRAYAARKAEHLKAANSGHPTCKCKCPLATAQGYESCLDAFGRGSFLTFHHEYYGSELTRMDAPSATGRKKQTRFDQAPANGLGL